jgi:subtilisin family serine protease
MVRDVRQDAPAQREIDACLRDYQEREKLTLISSKLDQIPLSGSRIIETDDQTIDEIELQLPRESKVFKDEPFTLIRPTRRAKRNTDHLLDDQLWHLSAIGAKEAQRRGITRTGAGVTVAVMDTGIEASVNELENRVIASFRVNLENGRVEEELPCRDTDDHGTHVTALICGRTVGVAKGVDIVNCTTIPHGKGSLSNFIASVEWAAQRSEIDIVNISGGMPGYFPHMEDIMYTLLSVGILPVVAVGNEGRHRTRSPGNCRDVLSVGAATKNYKVASFSGSSNIITNNQMYAKPDLVAPGDSVYSCLRSGRFEAWDGTSMAAPLVTGIAALILERSRDLGVLELMELILDKCRDLHKFRDRQGMGLVQVF